MKRIKAFLTPRNPAPSCSRCPGISLGRGGPLGRGARRWPRNAARLGENGTLALSDGVIGVEREFEKLQWSACNTPLVFLLLFFRCPPPLPFLQPRSHSSTHSEAPLPFLPIAVPGAPAAVYIYMAGCIQSTFNPLGLVQGPCSFCRRQFQPPL